jgi:hypothetical protein
MDCIRSIKKNPKRKIKKAVKRFPWKLLVMHSKQANGKLQAAPTSIFLPFTLLHSIAAEPTIVKAAMIAATKNACVRALL